MKKKISFVSPCYNEEDNVKPFYQMVKTTLKDTEYEYEIVFINDGSKDDTYENLKELYENDKQHVKVVNFLRNFGKEAALLAGLSNADGDYICTIDSDLQQEPKYGIEMARILDNNETINMVAAKPSNEKDSKILALFKKTFYTIINKIAEVPFYQGVSDFRVFRKSVCDTIVSMPEHNRFSKGIFSWVSPEIQCIDYEVKNRINGTTKWSFIKLFKYAIEGICSFSHIPLLTPFFISGIEGVVALILFLIGSIGGIIGHSSPFFMMFFLISCVLSIGALNLICMGIFGQYLAKIHTETTNRPLFVIKNILKGDN
jgi:glycosyltransferase involved in cell wall biosynthesis